MEDPRMFSRMLARFGVTIAVIVALGHANTPLVVICLSAIYATNVGRYRERVTCRYQRVRQCEPTSPTSGSLQMRA